MKYLEDLRNKLGFSDGEKMPSGISKYREAYIRTINHFAEKRGSGFRMIAFNRSGLHNNCLMFPETLDRFELRGDQGQDGRLNLFNDSPSVDDAFMEAVTDAIDFDPDRFVHVQVKLDLNSLSLELKDLR